MVACRSGRWPAARVRGPAGPDWFQKMDRNHDGDVSRREFLGPREHFDRLDRDNDGLIDADEAAGRRHGWPLICESDGLRVRLPRSGGRSVPTRERRTKGWFSVGECGGLRVSLPRSGWRGCSDAGAWCRREQHTFAERKATMKRASG